MFTPGDREPQAIFFSTYDFFVFRDRQPRVFGAFTSAKQAPTRERFAKFPLLGKNFFRLTLKKFAEQGAALVRAHPEGRGKGLQKAFGGRFAIHGND